jgi:tRNA(Ile)-lysidine synthase TilS/MesJ
LEKNFFKDLLKNADFLKIAIMAIMAIVILVFSGYTVTTQFGSIYKNDTDKKLLQYLVKIKAQSNYTQDMKDRILRDLGNLYEEKLILYCKEKNIDVSSDRIISDVKYYRMIVSMMNETCEEITIYRYIYDNDLYRYSNLNDWKNFKAGVTDLFIAQGKKILMDNYDNTKVIMPIHIWMRYAGKDLVDCLTINTDKLLEDLKTESVIFFNLCKK